MCGSGSGDREHLAICGEDVYRGSARAWKRLGTGTTDTTGREQLVWRSSGIPRTKSGRSSAGCRHFHFEWYRTILNSPRKWSRLSLQRSGSSPRNLNLFSLYFRSTNRAPFGWYMLCISAQRVIWFSLVIEFEPARHHSPLKFGGQKFRYSGLGDCVC